MGEVLYFDTNATTPLRAEALESMTPWLTTNYGNPSSVYDMGIKAHMALENSREIIADMINAEPSEIFFTSGGSEANTWALTRVRKNYDCWRDGRILISPIEHHSVLNAAHATEWVDYCDVNIFGGIETFSLASKIKDKTFMVSTMLVNNEIGSIEPIERISPICADHGIFYHVDAVQAFGHLPIDVKKLEGVTSLSASAHKIGGPKGIGFLYISKEVQPLYSPLIYGGKQEQGLRGGTENLASIVGFARACELAKKEMGSDTALRALNIYAWDFLKDNISNVRLNGYPIMDKRRMPNNLNVSIEGINGEELVEVLNEQGICISTGSACNTGMDEPSHVLKAIGCTNAQANSSIRISFDCNTKLVDINLLCQKIVEDVEMLRG